MTEEISAHTHNGSDSSILEFDQIFTDAPQPAIANVSGTLGGTYTGTEQAILQGLITKYNTLLAELRVLKIIKS